MIQRFILCHVADELNHAISSAAAGLIQTQRPEIRIGERNVNYKTYTI